MKTSFTCYDMNASHPFNADPLNYSDGKHRGRQYQVRAELRVNGQWRGHILYERHVPGSFHAGHSCRALQRLVLSHGSSLQFLGEDSAPALK